MNSLLNKIQSDYQKAFKKGDKLLVSTLRLLLAAIHNQEIENRAQKKELTEEEILEVIQKEAKKRREAIEAYEKGQREELANKEKKELTILTGYLPKQLSDAGLKKLVDQAIEKTNACGLKDMGQVMGVLMGQLKGMAEGKRVSQVVKEALRQ